MLPGIVCFSAEGKPMFLLSGDDSGQAFVLEADSDDPEDWSYTLSAPFLDLGEGNIVANPVLTP